ncbi:MAG: class I SAM-dependent methyltransferase [Cyanobacteriota bacterium]|nr:class I SAM-dependent methyltransferase [Cyanobacteriota bacterium]
MTLTENNSSEYVGPKLGGFGTKLSWYARQKMFDLLMALANPTARRTVLDVGVTSDRREDCNFFERLYPHKDKITAVGMEDASFLEQEYPGLKYVRSDGLALPFPDKSFDLVVSFAVIEHVGSRVQQKAFVMELCRVGKTCCFTTPNRWYPVEFHTAVPLIHWLPPSWFRALLKLLGKHFFAKEENLNLLSEKEVLKMLPADAQVSTRHFRLLGLISNLLFYVI